MEPLERAFTSFLSDALDLKALPRPRGSGHADPSQYNEETIEVLG